MFLRTPSCFLMCEKIPVIENIVWSSNLPVSLPHCVSRSAPGHSGPVKVIQGRAISVRALPKFRQKFQLQTNEVKKQNAPGTWLLNFDVVCLEKYRQTRVIVDRIFLRNNKYNSMKIVFILTAIYRRMKGPNLDLKRV